MNIKGLCFNIKGWERVCLYLTVRFQIWMFVLISFLIIISVVVLVKLHRTHITFRVCSECHIFKLLTKWYPIEWYWSNTVLWLVIPIFRMTFSMIYLYEVLKRHQLSLSVICSCTVLFHVAAYPSHDPCGMKLYLELLCMYLYLFVVYET